MLVVYQSWFESIDTLTNIQLEEFLSFFSGNYLITTPRNREFKKERETYEITIGTTGFKNLLTRPYVSIRSSGPEQGLLKSLP